MKRAISILLTVGAVAAVIAAPLARAADAAVQPLQVPAKSLPVPTAGISPGMQSFIGAPLNKDWNQLWKTGDEARKYANVQAANAAKGIPGMLERLHVTSEASTIDGVKVYTLTPDNIPPENRDKVLHPCARRLLRPVPRRGRNDRGDHDGRLRPLQVISVDYRMLRLEAYFPAALDDAVTVYKSVLKTTAAKNVRLLRHLRRRRASTLQMVLRSRAQGLPVPGAIAPGTPMSDVTKTGDSFYTNEKVDNIRAPRDGFRDAGTVIYAQGS